MSASLSALAGTWATPALYIDVAKLTAAYFDLRPDVEFVSQQVSFGTSGHRGGALTSSFNQWHVWAIVQAICDYRKSNSTTGPLFLGYDTHALSAPAFESALEVLAANGVETCIAAKGEFTPTPAISRAILRHNFAANSSSKSAPILPNNEVLGAGLCDGIVITSSHNPPDSGGLKYNLPNGGAADTSATHWIQMRANQLLAGRIQDVRRLTFSQAIAATTMHTVDFLSAYVADLAAVIDLRAIQQSGLRIGVDPMGGAGVHYWPRIAEQYKLDLTVVNPIVDPQFGFMSLDWDGKIRMDPSSGFAMRRLIDVKELFALGLACDTDHDRHGIVTRDGLLSTNQFLSVAIDYLCTHRPQWNENMGIGKTMVSSVMWDRVAAHRGRRIYEVPVGFKYFAEGLCQGALAFAGEESAGASFACIDGRVWTSDKDGIASALLAAEITAVTGCDPAQQYQILVRTLGATYSERADVAASAKQRERLAERTAKSIPNTVLAGDLITQTLDHAPGNQAALGGIKVITRSGWFAARPSGTEDHYKLYAESYRSQTHAKEILLEAQALVDATLAQDDD